MFSRTSKRNDEPSLPTTFRNSIHILRIVFSYFQDHVAATFGAGLNLACVVDVGHEKVSISCVEDGISLPNTRIRLGYGGADITQTLHWLLQKCAFPYTRCDPLYSRSDAFLMQKLKHEFCHLHFDVCGCYEKTFVVRRPAKAAQRYTIQVFFYYYYCSSGKRDQKPIFKKWNK